MRSKTQFVDYRATKRVVFNLLAPLMLCGKITAANTDGFDYPFGPPNGLPRCPGIAQCANGWQNVLDFTVINHLGEDWNFGFADDDLRLPIYASANGEVVYAQDVGGNGSWKGVIIILHTGPTLQIPSDGTVSGVKSLYGHLDPTTINNWVQVGTMVTRGQKIGEIGPTPTGGSGPHLHFEIRTNLSIEVGPGYNIDPTGWIDPSDFIDANRPSRVPFVLTPEKAFQVTFPAKESYQYQVEYSSNLVNWLAASEKIVACSSNETLTFKMTNGNSVFYRGVESPPDLSRRIPGLTKTFLDTAFTSSQSNRMIIEGMRVESRDYNFNDWIIATYDLDLCRQAFFIQELEVITNVGVTCGTSPLFFLRDVPRALVLSNATAILTAGTSWNITSTGQTFHVHMQTAQILSLVIEFASDEFQFIVHDPKGSRILSYPLAAQGIMLFPISVFRSGLYSIQFQPRIPGRTISLRLRFNNTNRKPTKLITSGQILSASVANYWNDYDKFTVNLNAGQTLRLPGWVTGTRSEIFDSRGVRLMSWGGGLEMIFTAPKTDRYVLIFYNEDGQAHSYSATINISP